MNRLRLGNIGVGGRARLVWTGWLRVGKCVLGGWGRAGLLDGQIWATMSCLMLDVDGLTDWGGKSELVVG